MPLQHLRSRQIWQAALQDMESASWLFRPWTSILSFILYRWHIVMGWWSLIMHIIRGCFFTFIINRYCLLWIKNRGGEVGKHLRHAPFAYLLIGRIFQNIATHSKAGDIVCSSSTTFLSMSTINFEGLIEKIIHKTAAMCRSCKWPRFWLQAEKSPHCVRKFRLQWGGFFSRLYFKFGCSSR